MTLDDLTLQELIVRALTSDDGKARQSLHLATASDPELKQFCDDLDKMVNTLAGSTDWRREKPSPELTASVREAVVATLPSSPAHFRSVLLESDLGRPWAKARLLLFCLLGAALIGLVVWAWLKGWEDRGRLALKGKLVYDTTFDEGLNEEWISVNGLTWNDKNKLRYQGDRDSDAVFMKQGFKADTALAFNLDLQLPGLDDTSSVFVFVADAEGSEAPTFDAGARPEHGLTLEITREGLILYDAAHELLQSKPYSNVNARFYRVRLEYLGAEARVLVNDSLFYEGSVTRMLQGPIHPGLRVFGPKRNETMVTGVRIER